MTTDAWRFCSNIQSYHPEHTFGSDRVGSLMILLGALYFCTGFVIIYFIKLQEYYARQGVDNAVQSVIFPVFVNVMWCNAFINVYVGFIALAFAFEPINSNSSKSAIAYAFMFTLEHAVVEGVAILLMQKGLGRNAAMRAGKYTLVWSLATFLLIYGIYTDSKALSFSLSVIWNLILIVFYGLLWKFPMKHLYRRPAAIFYAKFWFIFRTVYLLSSILQYISATFAAGNCMYVFAGLYVYVLFHPFVLYYTFLQDSRWWQGMDISSRHSTSQHNRDKGSYSGSRGQGGDIKSPLQGVDLDIHSAQNLASSLDDIGVGSSRPVKLLNFAYINMNTAQLLGSGSFSKVFLGRYRQQRCAIKLIFTVDLTKDVIRRVAAESEILSKIRHPNIVNIIGVSVLPPSVCILLEVCKFGSLADIIHRTGPLHLLRPSQLLNSSAVIRTNDQALALQAQLKYLRAFLFGRELSATSMNICATSKRQLNISWRERLHLAVGCARGLAALHAFENANLMHRDIKSFNFLVDAQLTAKLSDLELGAEAIATDADSSHTLKTTNDTPTSTSEVIAIRENSNSNSNSSNAVNNGSAIFSVSYTSSVDTIATDLEANLAAATTSPPRRLSSPSSVEQKEVNISSAVEDSEQTDDEQQVDAEFNADEFLANWAAPEVIRNGRFSQASDIYSFALVLYELLVCEVPFNEVVRQDDIRQMVLRGERPEIPAIFLRNAHTYEMTATDSQMRNTSLDSSMSMQSIQSIQSIQSMQSMQSSLVSATENKSQHSQSHSHSNNSHSNNSHRQKTRFNGKVGEMMNIAAEEVHRMIAEQQFIAERYFDEYIQLMGRCWAQNPKQRPSIDAVLTALEKIYIETVISSDRSRADSPYKLMTATNALENILYTTCNTNSSGNSNFYGTWATTAKFDPMPYSSYNSTYTRFTAPAMIDQTVDSKQDNESVKDIESPSNQQIEKITSSYSLRSSVSSTSYSRSTPVLAQGTVKYLPRSFIERVWDNLRHQQHHYQQVAVSEKAYDQLEVFEQSGQAILLVSNAATGFIVIYATQSFLQNFGLELEEIVGSSLLTLPCFLDLAKKATDLQRLRRRRSNLCLSLCLAGARKICPCMRCGQSSDHLTAATPTTQQQQQQIASAAMTTTNSTTEEISSIADLLLSYAPVQQDFLSRLKTLSTTNNPNSNSNEYHSEQANILLHSVLPLYGSRPAPGIEDMQRDSFHSEQSSSPNSRSNSINQHSNPNQNIPLNIQIDHAIRQSLQFIVRGTATGSPTHRSESAENHHHQSSNSNSSHQHIIENILHRTSKTNTSNKSSDDQSVHTSNTTANPVASSQGIAESLENYEPHLGLYSIFAFPIMRMKSSPSVHSYQNNKYNINTLKENVDENPEENAASSPAESLAHSAPSPMTLMNYHELNNNNNNSSSSKNKNYDYVSNQRPVSISALTRSPNRKKTPEAISSEDVAEKKPLSLLSQIIHDEAVEETSTASSDQQDDAASTPRAQQTRSMKIVSPSRSNKPAMRRNSTNTITSGNSSNMNISSNSNQIDSQCPDNTAGSSKTWAETFGFKKKASDDVAMIAISFTRMSSLVSYSAIND